MREREREKLKDRLFIPSARRKSFAPRLLCVELADSFWRDVDKWSSSKKKRKNNNDKSWEAAAVRLFRFSRNNGTRATSIILHVELYN